MVAGEVVDIQKLAGIDRPDISILSDEFLEDVRKMPERNLAAELLERLLEDNIRQRGRTHIQQEKKYSELLEAALNKYRNRSIETAQVIEELIAIARKMRDDGPPEGLTEEEFAFYGAISTRRRGRRRRWSMCSSRRKDWPINERGNLQISFFGAEHHPRDWANAHCKTQWQLTCS